MSARIKNPNPFFKKKMSDNPCMVKDCNSDEMGIIVKFRSIKYIVLFFGLLVWYDIQRDKEGYYGKYRSPYR